MKITLNFAVTAVALTTGIEVAALAQGTAFTYQGQLTSGGASITGFYDLRFTIYDALVNGNAVAGPLTNSATAVSNGLFTTVLDFGASPFSGANRWLEIAAGTNGGGAFITLSPRQPLTSAPYAIFAENVGAGGLTAGIYGNGVTFTNAANNFSGSFNGNGASLSNVNSATLGGLASSNFWRTTGNTGTTAGANFLGTSDNQPLELRVNGTRAARFEPNANGAPNLIGGAPVNFAAPGVLGAVIAGGGALIYNGFVRTNSVSADFGAIGGGYGNTILNSATDSTIGGGVGNTIQAGAISSTIAGGQLNQIQNNALVATIGGGFGNAVTGTGSFIGGGGYDGTSILGNAANGSASTVVGGLGNASTANYATVGGGMRNIASALGSTIGGGTNNQAGASFSSVFGGWKNSIQNSSDYSLIGGGYNNVVNSSAPFATIAGGDFNSSAGTASTLSGGRFNFIGSSATSATIGGGDSNTNNGGTATISGGLGNIASGLGATIPGGVGNVANGYTSFAAGWQAQALHDGTFVWADSTGDLFPSTAPNQFLIRAFGGVGIGTPNPQGSLHVYSTNNPTVLRIQSTGTPGFGRVEFVSNPQGDLNEWRPAFIQSLDAGGFTGGLGFYLNGTGSGNKVSTNEVMRLINGNVGIGTNNPTHRLQVVSAYCDGATWVNTSDRSLKQNFTAINPVAVLQKIAALPITEWQYQSEPEGTRHLGPMAQDFHAAFGLNGSDDKSISTVDEGGVALAAIQGLNQKLEARSEKLERENAELKQELAEIRALVKQLAQAQHE